MTVEEAQKVCKGGKKVTHISFDGYISFSINKGYITNERLRIPQAWWNREDLKNNWSIHNKNK